jgi:hypothetical protein
MRIRIQIFTLMLIRIQLPKIMRILIRNPAFEKLNGSTGNFDVLTWKRMSLRTVKELHNMECELVAQREQMAAKQREHMEEKEKLKRLKVLSGILFADLTICRATQLRYC